MDKPFYEKRKQLNFDRKKLALFELNLIQKLHFIKLQYVSIICLSFKMLFALFLAIIFPPVIPRYLEVHVTIFMTFN